MYDVRITDDGDAATLRSTWRALWLAALLLGAALPWRPAYAAEAEPPPYLLQAGDILHVSVWKETELQAEVLVRSDGGISFPLAGDVRAAGKSVAALSEELTARIAKFIPDPVVTVAIKANNGNHIYVVGKVNRPGEFPFNRPIDVMQALAVAGGTTPYAAVADIRVLRREGGKATAIKFDYTDIEHGRALENNIVLKSGDTVVVP
jgi:polysaccharide export outer membrane protein